MLLKGEQLPWGNPGPTTGVFVEDILYLSYVFCLSRLREGGVTSSDLYLFWCWKKLAKFELDTLFILVGIIQPGTNKIVSCRGSGWAVSVSSSHGPEARWVELWGGCKELSTLIDWKYRRSTKLIVTLLPIGFPSLDTKLRCKGDNLD